MIRLTALSIIQYMFGPDLLVAPVFSPEGEVTFYVPKGRWVGLIDGKERTGPAWFTETHDFSTFPLLVREQAVIVLAVNTQSPVYDLIRGGFEVVVNGQQRIERTIEVVQDWSTVVVQVKDGKAWARNEHGAIVSGKIKVL